MSQLPDYKKLKKFAEVCRKVGIKHFKCNEFEFTLSDELPTNTRRKRKVEVTPATQDPVTSEDVLTEEQLLFWSSSDVQSIPESETPQ